MHCRKISHYELTFSHYDYLGTIGSVIEQFQHHIVRQGVAIWRGDCLRGREGVGAARCRWCSQRAAGRAPMYRYYCIVCSGISLCSCLHLEGREFKSLNRATGNKDLRRIDRVRVHKTCLTRFSPKVRLF